MSQDIKNIRQKIMTEIQEGKLKMRPKIYFAIGSAFTLIGLVASIAISVFAVGWIRFIVRSNGIFGHKLERLLSIFPWWLLMIAVIGLVTGVMLVRKYDFSYKIDLKKGLILMILIVIISGWLVDTLGFNDLLSRRGLMKGMMRNTPQHQLK